MTNLNYLETSGWLNSLKEGKSIDYNYHPLPWYSYPAIEFIEDKLKSDFRVFEYGSGQSTFWYADRVKQVVSVEHNPDYFVNVSTYIPQNVKLVLREDRQRYVEEIQNYENGDFDVIIIDGIERVKCAEICGEKLSKNGWIVFDNSDREENDRGVILLHHQGFKRIDFYGLVPSQRYKSCTSIFFQSDDFLSDLKLPSQKQSCLGISLGQGEARAKRKNKNLDSQNHQILAYYEAIKNQPYAAEAYQGLGDFYYSKGQIEKSIRSYNKAIKLQPNLAIVYAKLGKIYSQKGQL
ncbi:MULTISPECIES: tetratricopeptide repeat protein [Okeania]|uniref:Tetratricopeptide repeat protein n=1 Tax=Okeania hirsuta TaxID=1458930 RepID=A0A3N6QT50_9CYAN|nr:MULTISPECIES: tetratricopeptide repeat protein [Okeania]NET13606.1 tetratricopeptide repeat protein [Okeania sp. SIO1H6]NES75543.1 tetratricopeptide repeat protein [Okeania sp. SIO1H4]NES91625.1 tetratricopeptide repeat protein [Okeania sp. SIO2B9]NET17971.1 tetratricopeptide repeat protein [Okeania sp. SIO1H5]NET76173.1 tetratricopeptide repeat protein [Okeania sp. SIO1F9]